LSRLLRDPEREPRVPRLSGPLRARRLHGQQQQQQQREPRGAGAQGRGALGRGAGGGCGRGCMDAASSHLDSSRMQ
jgi:hypothetical protein